jgi:hypothetical protein
MRFFSKFATFLANFITTISATENHNWWRLQSCSSWTILVSRGGNYVDVMPHNLVDLYQRSKRTFCFSLQGRRIIQADDFQLCTYPNHLVTSLTVDQRILLSIFFSNLPNVRNSINPINNSQPRHSIYVTSGVRSGIGDRTGQSRHKRGSM